MLAYAANTPKAGRRAASPQALALVIAGHAAVIAAVLATRPDLVIPPKQEPTVVVDIREPTKPPPVPESRAEVKKPTPAIQDSAIDRTQPVVDMGQVTAINVDRGQPPDLGRILGSDPIALDPPKQVPVKVAARFATPSHAVKPPYPLEKRRDEEEASLKLRLSIDSRGRVVAVEPVGAADPAFLDAARRHILRAWRYKPATEDGVAVPSSTVISLAFRLEDV